MHVEMREFPGVTVAFGQVCNHSIVGTIVRVKAYCSSAIMLKLRFIQVSSLLGNYITTTNNDTYLAGGRSVGSTVETYTWYGNTHCRISEGHGQVTPARAASDERIGLGQVMRG